MGCGASKRKVGTSVDLALEDTGDQRLDEAFRELQTPLLTLTEARIKLAKAMKDFAKEVGTHKQLANPTFFDSLMAMLFCFSASGEGLLENVDFAYSQSPPFIAVNTDLLYIEHRKIVPVWNHLVTLAHELPGQLKDLPELVQRAIQETSSK